MREDDTVWSDLSFFSVFHHHSLCFPTHFPSSFHQGAAGDTQIPLPIKKIKLINTKYIMLSPKRKCIIYHDPTPCIFLARILLLDLRGPWNFLFHLQQQTKKNSTGTWCLFFKTWKFLPCLK
jgi:hypothetical protein